jgi:opacity protein-like surface antigen
LLDESPILDSPGQPEVVAPKRRKVIMSTRSTVLTALALAALLPCSRAEAREHIYISPMAGYTTSGGLEMEDPALKKVNVGPGFTWGGQIGFVAQPGFTFEASYMQQESHLRNGSTDILGLKVGQLHGNFLFEKIRYGTKTQPYFLLGLGATFFQPDGGFDGKTNFSFALGGGVKINAGEKLGLKIQAKYNPTTLSSDFGGVWCDPFYCYEVADPEYLDQGEFTAGLMYKLGN